MSADNILLAVPNISEGRGQRKGRTIAGTDPVILDIHSDVDHNRSVLRTEGNPKPLWPAVAAMIERAVRELDLREQEGAHPRFGVVDVLPFVPYSVPEDVALTAATGLVWTTAESTGVPIHFYKRAAEDRRSLPQLRRWLREAKPPVHPSAGVICVGVRDPLIAFNVNFKGSSRRSRGHRAKDPKCGHSSAGFNLPSRNLVQVSMNLSIPRAQVRLRPTAVSPKQGRSVWLTARVVGLVPEAVVTELEGLPRRSPARSIEQALGENR